MKKSLKYLFCALFAISIEGCSSPDNIKHDHHHHSEESAAHDHHDAGGEEIVLAPAEAERLGVSTSQPVRRAIGSVVRAGGIIEASSDAQAVVTAPTAGILSIQPGLTLGSEVSRGMAVAHITAGSVSGGSPDKVAKVELEAARAEYDRIKTLWADRLVTLAQLNEAKAAYERAAAAYSAPAAGGMAYSPMAGVVTTLEAKPGQYVAAGDPIATISSATTLTLRAMVPALSYPRASSAADARIDASYLAKPVTVSSLGGRRRNVNYGTAAGTGGYVPVEFSIKNDGTLIPGTAVEVYLLAPGGEECLTVPRSALSEQQGEFFVYTRLDEDCYAKVPVETGATDGLEVEILSGLHGDEQVVVSGVTTVRLAASSGNIPEGHSHSH